MVRRNAQNYNYDSDMSENTEEELNVLNEEEKKQEED